jgi:hypothetical protein
LFDELVPIFNNFNDTSLYSAPFTNVINALKTAIPGLSYRANEAASRITVNTGWIAYGYIYTTPTRVVLDSLPYTGYNRELRPNTKYILFFKEGQVPTLPPIVCNSITGICCDAPAGSYCVPGTSTILPCTTTVAPPGSYCPGDIYLGKQCTISDTPVNYYCPGGTSLPTQCSFPGYTCPGANSPPIPSPAGYYSRDGVTKSICTAENTSNHRFYCPEGVFAPTQVWCPNASETASVSNITGLPGVSLPRAFAFSKGYLYVAQAHGIQRWTKYTGWELFAGSTSSGYNIGYFSTINRLDARFRSITGLCISSDDNSMYITDNGAGALVKLDMTSANGPVRTVHGFSSPWGVSEDKRTKLLYVTDDFRNTLSEVNADARTSRIVASNLPGAKGLGVHSYTGYSRMAPNELTEDVNIYIACSTDHTVKLWIKSNNSVITVVGTNGVQGNTDLSRTFSVYSVDNGTPHTYYGGIPNTYLNAPQGITILPPRWATYECSLYVTDANNQKVYRINAGSIWHTGRDYVQRTFSMYTFAPKIGTDDYRDSIYATYNIIFTSPTCILYDNSNRVTYIGDEISDNTRNIFRIGRPMCDPATGQ